LDLDPSVLGISNEAAPPTQAHVPPSLNDQLRLMKESLQQPAEARFKSAKQLRLAFDSISSQLPLPLSSSLFFVSCLESRQGSFEEVVRRIAARKAEEAVRKQVFDQYQALKLKSITLDTSTKVTSLTSCHEDLEAKKQRLQAELNQVESDIQARKLEME
jgi:hypothetical protein